MLDGWCVFWDGVSIDAWIFIYKATVLPSKILWDSEFGKQQIKYSKRTPSRHQKPESNTATACLVKIKATTQQKSSSSS